MNRMQFKASEGLIIQLKQVDDDVAIKGWDQDAVELILDGDSDQCIVQEQGQELTIESRIALSISVPKTSSVNVGQVSGDLLLRDMVGPVSVDTVHGEILVRSGAAPVSIQAAHGDLTVEQQKGPLTVNEVYADARLNQVDAPVSLGSVHGDVRARAIRSDLKMGTVSGYVRVRDVAGVVTLEEGSSNFRGTDLRGGMALHNVKGELSLKTALTPGMTYSGQADGNIIARFPAEASARFTLEAGGTLLAKLPLVEEQGANRMVGQAGDGEAQVSLHALGDLSLKIRGQGRGEEEFQLDFDFDQDIAAQVEAQIAERLGGLDLDALAQREIEKAMRKAEREIEKARLRVEKETQRAEERMRHAQERAARAARRAQEKITRRSRRWREPLGGASYTFKTGRRGQPQVSEEEQLSILRMVQEGKISVEEAEQLLKALEGESP